ncbi:MAG: RIP metalloprotease RseP [Woeseiaceae bacterium]|nr:RIP metalloprotease RseP [Woeseiaceae bacterium]NIP19720.1 RIP metalloprotease RseP [Woeseiaceae bacterium]NIS89837.1 RIP metalloprotease RseP [Woeseiaceae bacterium]
MGDFLTSLLAFIVAISVLVAIHEYGHYIVGRWAGMKVLRFSVGFGKPIWTWVRGADKTEYCVSAIPLGGYVRFLDGREGPVAPEDEGRAFNHRPVSARIAVLLAGPLFNFLFAVVAYWLLSMDGVPALRPAIGEVTPDSYAAEAGLETGDQIIAVGDTETGDWQQALMAMFDNMVESGHIPMTLENRDGRQRRTVIRVGEDSARLTEPGLLFEGIGFNPGSPPVILGEPTENEAAARAGMRLGDRIVSVDGEPILGFTDLVDAVVGRPDERVRIGVVRDRRLEHFDVVLGTREVDGRTAGYLGVSALFDELGPVEAIPNAIRDTWSQTMFTVRMLGRMVTGDVSVKNISGPINIAQFAGDSAQRGMRYFLGFLAMISISLGVLNLLPVPVLDGGQIVYQTIEGLKGSPLSERAQIIGQQFGILALILLMSFAFYNDIARIFG